MVVKLGLWQRWQKCYTHILNVCITVSRRAEQSWVSGNKNMLTKTSACSCFDWQCWKQIQGLKSYKTQAIALMLTNDCCIQWKHLSCTLPNDIIGTREQLDLDKYQTSHAACTNQIPLHHFLFSKSQELYLMTAKKVTKLLSSTFSLFPPPCFLRLHLPEGPEGNQVTNKKVNKKTAFIDPWTS